MRIKINQNLLGLDGREPILDNGKILTLRDVCIAAVLTPVQEDDQKKKFEKWDIFKKLRDAKEVAELTVEEISIIKAGSGKIHPPLILGQCFEMLEKS
jgi:hypothetical protein